MLAWFGESGGRAVITCRPDDRERLEGMPLRELGVVGGDSVLGLGLDALRSAYEDGR